MDAWRATFREFATTRTEAQPELDVPEQAIDQLATLLLAFATGLGMVRLADPDGVSPRLLGTGFVMLISTLERSRAALELLIESG
jgi:hypothetical protein